MPTGFQVVNEAGQVQVDSEMRNMVFLRKFAPTFIANQIYDDGVTGYASAGHTVGLDSIVCIRSPSRPVALQRGNFVSGAGDLILYAHGTTPPTDVQVFVFAPMPVSATGFGLMVFDAAGNPTFAAGQQLMRVLGVAQVPNGVNGSAAPATVSLATNAADAPYAACLGLARSGFATHNGAASGASTWVFDGVQTPAAGTSVQVISTVRVGEPQFRSGGAYATYWPQGGMLLAVSVAGL